MAHYQRALRASGAMYRKLAAHQGHVPRAAQSARSICSTLRHRIRWPRRRTRPGPATSGTLLAQMQVTYRRPSTSCSTTSASTRSTSIADRPGFPPALAGRLSEETTRRNSARASVSGARARDSDRGAPMSSIGFTAFITARSTSVCPSSTEPADSVSNDRSPWKLTERRSSEDARRYHCHRPSTRCSSASGRCA